LSDANADGRGARRPLSTRWHSALPMLERLRRPVNGEGKKLEDLNPQDLMAPPAIDQLADDDRRGGQRHCRRGQRVQRPVYRSSAARVDGHDDADDEEHGDCRATVRVIEEAVTK